MLAGLSTELPSRTKTFLPSVATTSAFQRRGKLKGKEKSRSTEQQA